MISNVMTPTKCSAAEDGTGLVMPKGARRAGTGNILPFMLAAFLT